MKYNEVIEINQKEALKAIRKIKGDKIHCFIGFIGADWSKKDVINLVKKSKRMAWAYNIFLHNLVIINEGTQYLFDIKYNLELKQKHEAKIRNHNRS